MKTNKLYERMVNYNITDKDYAMKNFREEMLNKTQQIFEYSGLPESIPVEILELFLQTNGNVIFHKVNGELYIFVGGFGGEPDVYYRPTIYTVANPALKYSANVKIGTDGVLMRSDTNMQGILPLIYKWGSIMTELVISFRMATINSRIPFLISAGTDKEVESAKEFIKQIDKGNLSVIAENAFLEGIKTHQVSTQNNALGQLRETYQFIKSMLYSDLGMKVSHNMKREYVSEEENIVNDDTLLPLIDNMLMCRKTALEEANALFGTNMSVKLNGAWELQHEELEKSLEYINLSLEEEKALEESTGSEEIAGDTGESEESEETTEEETSEETSEETTEEENSEETTEPDIDINIVVGDESTIESSEESDEETEDEEPESEETEEEEEEKDED